MFHRLQYNQNFQPNRQRIFRLFYCLPARSACRHETHFHLKCEFYRILGSVISGPLCYIPLDLQSVRENLGAWDFLTPAKLRSQTTLAVKWACLSVFHTLPSDDTRYLFVMDAETVVNAKRPTIDELAGYLKLE